MIGRLRPTTRNLRFCEVPDLVEISYPGSAGRRICGDDKKLNPPHTPFFLARFTRAEGRLSKSWMIHYGLVDEGMRFYAFTSTFRACVTFSDLCSAIRLSHTCLELKCFLCNLEESFKCQRQRSYQFQPPTLPSANVHTSTNNRANWLRKWRQNLDQNFDL